jgi:hypothetical protein
MRTSFAPHSDAEEERADVAIEPHGQHTEVSVHEHPQERPEDWGWHGTFPRATQVAGWITAIVLIVMTTATHYNLQGTLWLLLFAGAIIAGLIYDIRQRRNAWRR